MVCVTRRSSSLRGPFADCVKRGLMTSALFVLGGCSPARSEAVVQPVVAVVSPASAFDAGRSGPIPTASVTASTPVHAPAVDCSDSGVVEDTRWIARLLTTGDMPGPHWLRSYKLGRSADRATLLIQEQQADKKPADGTTWSWNCTRSMLLTGTVTERGGQLLFQFTEATAPSKVHEITCAPRDLRVARAMAVRVDERSTEEGCNKHRWRPAANVVQSALVCNTKDEYWGDWGSRTIFAGRPPGLEHVTLDEDDCFDPAEALRLIPASGAFAPVR
jgi:hypothetical protein